MPKKSHQKQIHDRCFYIISNRSVDTVELFKEPEDFAYFVTCMKRYLDDMGQKDKEGRSYVALHTGIELVAYGLVPSSYNLLVFVKNATVLPRFVRGIMAAYGIYYRKKYAFTGTLFKERYEAVQQARGEVVRASLFVHQLPLREASSGFTSLGFYLSGKENFLATKYVTDDLTLPYASLLE